MGFRTSLDFSRAGNATWTFWKSLVFSVDIWRQSGVSPNRARIGLRFPVFPGIETVIPENETIIHAIPVIFTSVRQRRYLGVFGRAISARIDIQYQQLGKTSFFLNARVGPTLT